MLDRVFEGPTPLGLGCLRRFGRQRANPFFNARDIRRRDLTAHRHPRRNLATKDFEERALLGMPWNYSPAMAVPTSDHGLHILNRKPARLCLGRMTRGALR